MNGGLRSIKPIPLLSERSRAAMINASPRVRFNFTKWIYVSPNSSSKRDPSQHSFSILKASNVDKLDTLLLATW